MDKSLLDSVARSFVPGREGVLAAHENAYTIKKRLKSIDAESTEEARRSYRELSVWHCKQQKGARQSHEERMRLLRSTRNDDSRNRDSS